MGYPGITVIDDGGWAKPTYGHEYNSESGVVCNFMFCYICSCVLGCYSKTYNKKKRYLLVHAPETKCV